MPRFAPELTSLLNLATGQAGEWLRHAAPTLLPVVADTALKGAVLLALAAITTRLLHRSAAATRHLVWSAAMGGVLLLPLATWLAPRWPVAILPGGVDTRSVSDAPTLVHVGPGDRHAIAGAHSLAVASSGRHSERHASPAVSYTVHDADGLVKQGIIRAGDDAAALVHATATPSVVSAAAPSPSMSGSLRDSFSLHSLATTLLAIWLTGVAIGLARIALGAIGISRVAGRADPVTDPEWLLQLQRLARELGIRRPVTLLRDDSATVPVTWGAVYPVVLLPAGADSWTTERRRAVLVHELAHVERFDVVTHAVGQLALALCWFNPLAWIGVRRLAAERERACDDLVLETGARPSSYAESLLEIARTMGRGGPGHAVSALAMARPSEVEGRLLAILDPDVRRARTTRRRSLIATGLVLAAVVPLAALRPTRAEARTLADVRPVVLVAPGLEVQQHDIVAAPRLSDGGKLYEVIDSALRSMPDAMAMVSVADTGEKKKKGTSDTTRTERTTIVDDDGRVRSRTERRADGSSSSSTHITTRDGETASSCATFRGRGVHSIENNSGRSLRLIDDKRCIELRERGTVVFTDDDADVRSISAGGELMVAETRDGRTRRMTFVERDGQVVRTYDDGGAARPAADGMTWLRAVLGEAMREGGWNIEPRVARIRKQGGVRAVLDSVSRLTSDGVKRQYLNILLKDPTLGDDDLARTLTAAGREIESDGDRASLLRQAAPRAMTTTGARRAFFEALRMLDSDGDQASVLRVVLRTEALSEAAVAGTALATTAIESDGDRSSVLQDLVRRHSLDAPAVRTAFFESLNGINSDGDHARVLLSAVRRGDLAPAILIPLVNSAARIDSDGDKASVLRAVAALPALRDDAAARAAFLAAVATIQSDGDRTSVERRFRM